MIATEQVEQALMDAGFVPFMRDGGIVYGGFQVTSEDNGGTKITYVLATGTERISLQVRRDTVGAYFQRMERALSRAGYTVIMFEPDEGTDYRLTIAPTGRW
jgi:hypothetical protein